MSKVTCECESCLNRLGLAWTLNRYVNIFRNGTLAVAYEPVDLSLYLWQHAECWRLRDILPPMSIFTLKTTKKSPCAEFLRHWIVTLISQTRTALHLRLNTSSTTVYKTTFAWKPGFVSFGHHHQKPKVSTHHRWSATISGMCFASLTRLQDELSAHFQHVAFQIHHATVPSTPHSR